MSATPLLSQVAAADPEGRRRVLEGLASTPTPLDADALTAVVACLATPMKAVQRLAADLLAGVAADARPRVVTRLQAAMGSPDRELRWGATYALGRLGLVEAGMIEPLLEVLGARDGDRRWAAAELLVACARVAPDAVLAALLTATGDAEPERRKMALYALRDVAVASPAVRDATLRGLADPAVGVRFAALAALARLEPLPPTACGLVIALVRDDPDPGLRRAALTTLGLIGRGVSAVDEMIAAAATSADVGLRRASQIARRRLDV